MTRDEALAYAQAVTRKPHPLETEWITALRVLAEPVRAPTTVTVSWMAVHSEMEHAFQGGYNRSLCAGTVRPKIQFKRSGRCRSCTKALARELVCRECDRPHEGWEVIDAVPR